MNTHPSNTISSPPGLTTAQATVLAALQKLVRNYVAYSSGGFDPDDISLHCNLPSDQVQEHLHELETLGHITATEAPNGSAWDTHYRVSP
jgi:hypothetical protein